MMDRQTDGRVEGKGDIKRWVAHLKTVIKCLRILRVVTLYLSSILEKWQQYDLVQNNVKYSIQTTMYTTLYLCYAYSAIKEKHITHWFFCCKQNHNKWFFSFFNNVWLRHLKYTSLWMTNHELIIWTLKLTIVVLWLYEVSVDKTICIQ